MRKLGKNALANLELETNCQIDLGSTVTAVDSTNYKSGIVWGVNHDNDILNDNTFYKQTYNMLDETLNKNTVKEMRTDGTLLLDSTKTDKLSGNSKEMIFPSRVNGIKIKQIQRERLEKKTDGEGKGYIDYTILVGNNTIEKIYIPPSVIEVGGQNGGLFFKFTALKEVKIPSFYCIRSGTFQECSSLEKVELGTPVNSDGTIKTDAVIDGNAFQDCTSLAEINIPKGVNTIGYATFQGCSSLKKVELPDGLTKIGGLAFYNCKSLTDIHLPKTLVSVGGSFRGCTSLEDIALPDSLTVLSNELFYGCTSLKSIKIPNTVTTLGISIFHSCTALTEIKIPDSVTSIGNSAFIACSNLTSIDIPDGVTSIGVAAFQQCTSLTNVTLSANLSEIAAKLFMYSGLTSIDIPDGVRTIGFKAFQGCKITRIEIPSSVTGIAVDAFTSCSNLEKIIIYNDEGAIKNLPGENGSITGSAWGAPNNPTIVYKNK